MLHNFLFTVDTDEVAEKVRDDCAKWLGSHGTVVNAATVIGLPRFVVTGVDTDKRKSAPQPFEETVQAEDAAAAAAQFTGTKVVAKVEAKQ